MSTRQNPKDLRDAFGKALVELGDESKNIVVVNADVAHPTRASYFEEKYPKRFFEVGVAEQNLMGVAAGLATVGLVTFAVTFAVFASKKACDQVSISIAYPRLNVKVVGAYAGLTTPNTGATHQSVEDIAIMRAMPHMIVVVPADVIELRGAMKAISKYEGPVYLRIARSEVPTIFKDDYRFQLGKGLTLKEGDDVTLVGTGVMTAKCLEASGILAQEGINARVINIHTIKPIDEKIVIKAAKKTAAIVTAENHGIIGGLGSAVSEVLTDNFPVFLKRVGIKDSFGSSGKMDDLFKKYRLTPTDIANAAREVIKKRDNNSMRRM